MQMYLMNEHDTLRLCRALQGRFPGAGSSKLRDKQGCHHGVVVRRDDRNGADVDSLQAANEDVVEMTAEEDRALVDAECQLTEAQTRRDVGNDAIARIV